MDVDMEDTLSRGHIHVDAYVVAVGLEFLIHCCFFLSQQLHAGAYLFSPKIEEVCNMPERDNQGVARTDGVAVTLTVGQLVAPGHRSRAAKAARVIWVTHVARLIDDVIHGRLFHFPRPGFPVVLGQGEAVPIGVVKLHMIAPIVIPRPPRFLAEHRVLRHTL